MRAPWLKAAIIVAVVAALYGGFTLATRKPGAAPQLKTCDSTDLRPPRGFLCHMDVLSKTEFRIRCVPDCRVPPERALPYDRCNLLRAITADQTTPAVWHRACDGKPGTATR